MSVASPVRETKAGPDSPLREARLCYDHLAGCLGMQITDALLARRLRLPGNADHGGVACAPPAQRVWPGIRANTKRGETLGGSRDRFASPASEPTALRMRLPRLERTQGSPWRCARLGAGSADVRVRLAATKTRHALRDCHQDRAHGPGRVFRHRLDRMRSGCDLRRLRVCGAEVRSLPF